FLAELGIGFAMGKASTDTENLSSSATDLKLSLGYRITLPGPRPAPVILQFNLGYLRHGFSVEPSVAPLAYTSATFSGINGGGSATLTLSDRVSAGFDVSALLFPGVSEKPVESGSVNSVSGWTFSLKGQYHFTDVMDFTARLQFYNYNAEFV